MKILHQLGHNNKWSKDAYNENSVGDGFIYGAFNIPFETITNLPDEIVDISIIDLQYYGKRSSSGLGKLDTYPFHPANWSIKNPTDVIEISSIIDGITFQENAGFDKIIIPNYFFDQDIDKAIEVLNNINEYLKKNKNQNFSYYLTIPISNQIIKKDQIIQYYLSKLTEMDIVFDGYYIVIEPILGYKHKVSIDYDLLNNASEIFDVLKKQKFKLIYGYANFDALIYLSITDIDYVSIGTYENLRNFNHSRYSTSISGGPSDGWYFSEKLLNFVKAQQIVNVRRHGCLDYIRNDQNIFSDIILDENFIWNIHKPDVHKNYLVSTARLLKHVSGFKSKELRIRETIKLIEYAQNTYEQLSQRSTYLPDESDNYHLGTWMSFLRSKL